MSLEKYFDEANGFFKCMLCDGMNEKETKFKKNKAGTTTSRRYHLERVHPVEYLEYKTQQDNYKGARKRKSDVSEKVLEITSALFTTSNVPFSMADNPYYKQLINMIPKLKTVNHFFYI